MEDPCPDKPQPCGRNATGIFVKSSEISAPFSFFRYIFWDNQTTLQSTEGQQILRHELVHLQDKHSLDKIFMEVVTTIGWLNPFFYLIKLGTVAYP